MVDIVLVIVVLVPLVLGILQVALVLHVRNSLAAAAADGARYAAAQGRTSSDGVERTRRQIEAAVSGRFADDITVRRIVLGGVPTIEVIVDAEVPALGLGGPGVRLEVSGHATQEPP